ncbi:MAG TPA: response regulator transcription factor [Bacteroidales bacterium]|nr:response regulator transcription factor [Bacteroidales bacterium]
MTSDRKSKVIIADDHTLFRQGLKLILEDLDNIEVVADVANGKELVEITHQLNPDLIIMDINMPQVNGIEASRILLHENPELKILVVSMYGDEQYYNSVIENGVKGFILKDAENTELRAAVNLILSGKTYFSQELLLKLIRNRKNSNQIVLTQRERQILELICQGMNSSEIAGKLFLSERTIENHRANLLDKTGCRNSLSLVLYAFRNNLVDPGNS